MRNSVPPGWRVGRGRRLKKNGLAQVIEQALRAEAGQLPGEGVFDGVDFEALEMAGRRVALAVMGRAVASRLNAARDDETAGQPCDCGELARYAGRRKKTFVTALGPLVPERAWYQCEHCHAGFCPRDRALGLAGTSLSPAVLRMVGVSAARVSFADSSTLLRELAGLRIDPRQVERQAEAPGRAIAADEHSTVEPDPAPFAQRVRRETQRRGFDRAQRRVVLGDGAAWIWNMSAELFPDAIQVVDIFHAKGHLFEAARAIYGAGTDLADQWGKQRRDELDQGRIDAILTALAEHPACEEARTCSRYITNNRQRMDYPRFRAMGLCITTGVVEGACKHVVATRFKRGGMHWTVNGANAILALRCAILSNRFDDFRERRAGV